MYGEDLSAVSLPLIQMIEDAILLGGAKDIEDVLAVTQEMEDFPENLRYGLEALLYFRIYYGKNGDLAPKTDKDRNNMLYMESYWGKELIETVARCPELKQRKSA